MSKSALMRKPQTSEEKKRAGINSSEARIGKPRGKYKKKTAEEQRITALNCRLSRLGKIRGPYKKKL